MKKIMAKLLIASIMLGTVNLYAYNVYNRTGEAISFEDTVRFGAGMKVNIAPMGQASCNPTEKGCQGDIRVVIKKLSDKIVLCDPSGSFSISSDSPRGYYLEIYQNGYSGITLIWKKDNVTAPLRISEAKTCVSHPYL
jgi:hypothetical protein